MRTNIYATAVALSDRDLLARLDNLAATERETTAEMLAHLAALDLRASLYLAQGYGSLFDYCTRALHLSEDAACNRTKAVRACQEFPVILDLLFAGKLTLTAVRLLGPHLTLANHEAVLARAAGKGRGDVECLIAEIAPRPDVPTTIRKLVTPGADCLVLETADSRSLFTDARPASLPPAPATDDHNRGADQGSPASTLMARARSRTPRSGITKIESVSKRIDRHDTSPMRSSAPSGSGIRAGVPSSGRPGGDARSSTTCSSTTGTRTRWEERPPSTTSPCGAGGTTPSRRRWTLVRVTRRRSARCARCIRPAATRHDSPTPHAR